MIESISQDGGLLTIKWTGEPGVRLQRSVRLVNPDWIDIPDTDGKSSASEVADQAEGYYRLMRDE